MDYSIVAIIILILTIGIVFLMLRLLGMQSQIESVYKTGYNHGWDDGYNICRKDYEDQGDDRK